VSLALRQNGGECTLEKQRLKTMRVGLAMTNIVERSFTRGPSVLSLFAFAALFLYIYSAPSRAEDLSLSRWWIHTGGITHHISNDHNRNGENYGLGLEYKFSPTQSVAAGYIRNSYHRNAPIISYAWVPLKLGPVRVGGNLAIAGGYANRTGTLAAVIPWAEITWQYVGLELGLVPVRNGIVTLQFKFRFD
jgi:hypothetical protein